MRRILASIILASLIASPAQAADWRDQTVDVRPGAFVGARVQLPLGGNKAVKPRAALTVAPTQHRVSANGATRTGIGEGLSLNFAPGSKPSLTLAGMRADQALGLTSGPATDYGRKLGLSDTATIALGAVAVLIVAGGVFYAVATDCDAHDDECG